ncbi:MAG: DegT/DnrJ/EryC1/StrS family aminotransferase, partial [Lachnospiraceae bacterium]
TWNMSPEALQKAFAKYPHPKAVICVHLYGTPAKLDEIMAICEEHNVPLVEDAAESLSATYKGRQTGSFGKYGIISFNGNKIITTSSGGMIVGNDKEDIDKARFLATQARDPARHYQHSQIGYNYRLSNVLAGIGRGQFRSLELHHNLKKKIYETYREAFADIPEITMNPLNPDGEANYWLSCITIAPDCGVTPLMIMEALDAQNIESRPIWKPMQLQPVYADCDFFSHLDEGSVSEDIFNRGLCLPSDIKNTDEDMELIIRTIRGVFGR